MDKFDQSCANCYLAKFSGGQLVSWQILHFFKLLSIKYCGAKDLHRLKVIKLCDCQESLQNQAVKDTSICGVKHVSLFVRQEYSLQSPLCLTHVFKQHMVAILACGKIDNEI